MDAWCGRPFAPTWTALKTRLDQGLPVPPKVILAAGTNDIFNPPAARAAIAQAAAALGSRLVFVTVYAARPGREVHDLRNSSWVNAMLTQTAAQHGVRVVDWFSFLAAQPFSRPKAYLVDGVHTTASGTAARNSLLVAELRRG
jgi:lysophospholipase L1-like esterase